ncbi:MAG: anthranilate synthase component I family protein [Microbacterium sp.]
MPERLTARLVNGRIDPVALFVAAAAVSPDVFWLDSGSGANEGWSFIGTGNAGARPDQVRIDVSQSTGIPFSGGWVGWCDYESGARTAGAPVAEAESADWLRVTRIAAFDNTTGETWALAAGDEIDEWASFICAPRGAASARPSEPGARDAIARHTPGEYADLVEQCRALIRAGIAYQLCLTTQFTVPGAHDAIATYLRLRAATGAHHGGFVRIGERALLSASPEQFLHVENGVIRTRPIKGTRPRGKDSEADAALAAELQADPKERAENVMIVDLMRNDLSRVCEPGSIRVDQLWAVESYPTVHQLVSTVSGTAAEGTTVGMLLEATFPAGSMTGAPKLSAMTQLHALEGDARGIYAGCFGYVGDNGAVDLAMVIRSIVIEPDHAAVGAGGGITWRSVAASEVAEVATKARAPLAALAARIPALWCSDILN